MYSWGKRLFDILLSTVALLIISPLFIICIPILACTGEHEIWYLQKRVGYKNKIFKIWKFATMVKGSSKMGTGSLTLRNDPRVLPFGRLLRKTKINELPQIFNVLTGSMSMVGPRPQMEVDFCCYPESVQQIIYNMKPGITGIGSIIFRDEEKYLSAQGINPKEVYSEQIAPYKGALEIWYQNNASLWLDAKLVFLTAWVIIFPDSNLPHKWFSNLPPKPDWMCISHSKTSYSNQLDDLSFNSQLVKSNKTEKI
ncbi:sugar transferase [Bacteroides sedimenti]|uniref:Glycosyl transferase n=1 Tax=Bacteroides sedimenti TaxID=2136147 RepID=A0ABN6Z050_9BACE